MKSKCKNCEIDFSYSPSQKKGIFCSNSCQGDYVNKQKVLSGKASFKAVKKYVLKYWKYECSECNLNKWNGKHLTLQLDHKNGDKKDNRLDNVRWMCPNCHSQTDNWGVKNISVEGRKRLVTNKKK